MNAAKDFSSILLYFIEPLKNYDTLAEWLWHFESDTPVELKNSVIGIILKLCWKQGSSGMAILVGWLVHHCGTAL